MIVRPVISRELLAESRRPFNYWMRVTGAAVLLLAMVLFTLNPFGFAHGRGGILFGNLNALVFLAVWIVVPLLTADCISRERREGTLGLLFLTPLKSHSIVLAKSLVHALRASSLLLVAIPILAIPLLLGGVNGTDLLRTGLLDLGALVLALTAGLRASSICRERTRAIVLAMSLSLALALAFLEAHAVVLTGGPQRLGVCWTLATGAQGGSSSYQIFPGPGTFVAWSRSGGPPSFGSPLPAFLPPPRMLSGAGPRRAATGLQTAAGLSGACLMALLFVLLQAARRLRRNWQDESPSQRAQWWERTFCTPLLGRLFFQRRMTRTLNRNPIGWLQQYSWSARLSKWGWCLGLVLYECFLVAYGYWDDFINWQFTPALFLIGSMAFTAANSFSRERQTGALELLLVTPLPVKKIISGRLLGIWEQFLPSLVVWLVVWLTLSDHRYAALRMSYLIMFAGSFGTIAVIGLYYSLRRLHFLAAWVLTGAVGLLLPVLLSMMVHLGMRYVALYSGNVPAFSRWGNFSDTMQMLVYGILLFQIALAALAWIFLRRDLTRRLFVLT